MKGLFLIVFALFAIVTFAQQKTISQAILTTKTTIVIPEGEDESAPQASSNGDERRVMMRFGDAGETKAVTYLKNDLVKTVVKTDMANTTTIRNNAEKKTTTLIEAMGNKTGFYATDTDQEEMRKRMDSMMQARNQNAALAGTNNAPVVDVIYVEGSKKIAGFECKKALILSTRNTTITTETTITVKPVTDSSIVWYCPDFKLQGITSTGGTSGAFSFGRMGSLSGLDKLNGFPMEYEMKMQRGRKMIVEVTKIETEKEIKDKEFEIPKEYEVKPIKDMQNGMGNGRFQMRVGG